MILKYPYNALIRVERLETRVVRLADEYVRADTWMDRLIERGVDDLDKAIERLARAEDALREKVIELRAARKTFKALK